jgi:elongation factor P
MITATQIRVGNILKFNGDLCRVMKVTHVTPGKGNAVVQTDLRNLRSGLKFNNRFRSTETVEKVEVFDRKIQFLYQEGPTYHFMDPETYEQIEISEELLDEAVKFLKPEVVLTVSLHEGKPLGVNLPPRVTLKVTRCDPAGKGKAGATKEAVLENGNAVKVPLFIKEGDDIIVDTETNSYVEKG